MQKYILLIFSAALLLLCSCESTTQEKQIKSRKAWREQLRLDSLALKVGATPTMDCLPLFIAYERGWLTKDSLDIRVKLRNSHLDLDTLLDGGHIEGTATEKVRAKRLIDKGTALQYVAETNLKWQLITNKTTRIKKLSQLSDKMLAMTRFSATDSLADVAIANAKAKSDIYKVQINDVNIRLRMLLNNEMDAMFLPEPQATVARMHNHKAIADKLFSKTNVGVIAFRKAALADKRRKWQIAEFIKIYNQACDSITKYGVASYSDIIGKYMAADAKSVKAMPRLTYKHANLK